MRQSSSQSSEEADGDDRCGAGVARPLVQHSGPPTYLPAILALALSPVALPLLTSLFLSLSIFLSFTQRTLSVYIFLTFLDNQCPKPLTVSAGLVT